MRTFGKLSSLILFMALLLSACAGGTANTAVTPGAGVGAPTDAAGAGDLTTPTTGDLSGNLATPTIGDTTTDDTTPTVVDTTVVDTTAGAETSTPAATSAVDATGTPAAVTGTPEATTGADTTQTPAADAGAGTGSQGQAAEQGQYIRMTHLLDGVVNASDNSQVGRVDGILVERPAIPATGAPEEAAEGEATATPEPSPVPLSPEERQLFVRYLLVDAGDVAGGDPAGGTSGHEVLVPWEALGSVETWAGVETGALALEMDAAAFATAPRTSLVDISSGADVTGETASFWSEQGLSIPATGPATSEPGSLVLIPRERGTVGILSGEGDQLSEVADFLIDRETGEVIYVIFEGAETQEGRFFVVPAQNLSWTMNEGEANILNRGNFIFDFPAETWDTAPSFGSIDEISGAQDLDQQMDEFWQGVQGGGSTGTDSGGSGGTTP